LLAELRWRQPEAVLADPQAAAGGAPRDLPGAVQMSADPRLADNEGKPPAELARDLLDEAANLFEPRRVWMALGADAGRSAILAEHLAQHAAPFAGGDACFGGSDRRLHDVTPFGGCRFEIDQRLTHGLVVAPLAPGLQRRHLLDLDRLWHGDDAVGTGSERRRLRLGVGVDPDQQLLALLDGFDAGGVGRD